MQELIVVASQKKRYGLLLPEGFNAKNCWFNYKFQKCMDNKFQKMYGQ